MMQRLSYLTTLVLISAITALRGEQTPDPDPSRFAESIAKFAQADQVNPPEKGGIVFVGSSSIRMLDIQTYFPGLAALNLGFGGSHISDVNHYIEEIVLKYEPRLTVLYCGSNDLWSGKSAFQVLEDFLEFKTRLFDRVPESELIVLASRPSPKRHSGVERELAYNYLLQIEASRDPRITLLKDSSDRFFNNEGEYRMELFHQDKLHMSDAGYRVWKEILTPFLTD